MSRFGVMKHVRVLEEAGLVVTRKDGRSTRHFLNPIPIQLVADRWVDKYRAERASRSSTSRPPSSHAGAPITSADTSTYQPAVIPDEGPRRRCTASSSRRPPQEIWDALTLPEFSRRYFHGAAITMTPDRYESLGPDGASWGDAAVLRVGPAATGGPRLDVAATTRTSREEAESRVTWEISPSDDGTCLLTVDPRPARGRPAHRVRRRRSRLDGRPVGAQDPSGDGGAAAPDVRGGAGLTDAVTSARWCTHSCAACRTSHLTVRTSSGRRTTVRSHASSGTARTSSVKPCAAADSSARRTSSRVAA